MKNIILAWKNLWRNRRRTLITSASVFFAVLFALLFRSLQLGSYDHMFRSVIESYTGYIQIQNEGFWDEQIVDNSFLYDTTIERVINSDRNVAAAIPRFESFALASSGPLTKGVLVMGINPEKEMNLSDVEGKLVKFRLTPDALDRIKLNSDLPKKIKKLAAEYENNAYSNASRLQMDLGISEKAADQYMPIIEDLTTCSNGYIKMGEPGVLAGDKLAQYLDLGIGDTLVLISQGYHATTAAGKYVIRGIIKQPMPDLDNKIVYLPLDICQELYNAPGNFTSIALQVHNHSDKSIENTVLRLKEKLPEEIRIMDWREMNEVLVSQIDADNKSGMIMIGILYLVIAFGVFGTVLMMTVERRREFGVLVAIGMQKRKLASIISLEMLYIGLLGILSGSLIMIPVILFGLDHPIVFRGEWVSMFEEYGMEPIMPFQGIDFYFLWQMLIVAIMVLIALIYPVNKIFKLKVVTALRA